jgi:uncharacterized coiled-coil protein SlyX
MRSAVYSGLLTIGFAAMAAPAAGQTAPCDQCAKLDQLNASIEAQTTEVKSIRRQLERLTASLPKKSAVVIEFGDGITPPFHRTASSSNLKTADAIATEYCLTINFAAGKALSKRDTNDGAGVPAKREVTRLVCYS